MSLAELLCTERIAESLAELECQPSAREMLLEGLPHAFGGERHPYQVEYAKLLRKCLEGERDLRLEMQQKHTTAAGEIKTQLEGSQTDLASGEEKVQAALAGVEETAAALSIKQVASKEEEKEYLVAKADKETALLQREKLEREKAEVDSVANGSLQMLLNGSWEDKDACDDFVSAVFEYLKSMNCEAPLLASLPKALAQKPADRRLFDEVVFKEVVRIIGAKVTIVTSAIEKDEEEFKDVNATHLGAWAIWDVACDDERASVTSHEQAREILQVTKSDKSALEATIAEQSSLFEKAALEQALAESKAQEIERALMELERLNNDETQAENPVNGEISESSPKRRKIEAVEAVLPIVPAQGGS